ncbi:MAG: sigma-70 family RNA polymerase sigma factor [Bacillales bacterium]
MEGRGREISEQTLIQKILDGQNHAFRILVETYRAHLFRAVYSVLRDEKDAEDALQEVFLKIYLSLPQYKQQGLKTWMTRIAVNHAIDMKRKRERRQEDAAEHELYETATHPQQWVETVVLTKEQRNRIRQKLDELPEKYRNVIYDYYILEKSYRQIAEEQQIQVKSVEARLYRARLWMKKHWKEEDFL